MEVKISFLGEKDAILGYFRKKTGKSISNESWRAQIALNLRHFDVSNIHVAQLEKIWEANSDF